MTPREATLVILMCAIIWLLERIGQVGRTGTDRSDRADWSGSVGSGVSARLGSVRSARIGLRPNKHDTKHTFEAGKLTRTEAKVEVILR